jgi:hypothetical protein
LGATYSSEESAKRHVSTYIGEPDFLYHHKIIPLYTAPPSVEVLLEALRKIANAPLIKDTSIQAIATEVLYLQTYRGISHEFTTICKLRF